MGLLSNLRTLASTWTEAKIRSLQTGEPETAVDTAGRRNNPFSFQGRNLTHKDLKEIKQFKESGGLAARLFDAKAKMTFGTGATLEAEEDALEEWFAENLPDIDLLTLYLGTDATFYPYALVETVENRAGGFGQLAPVEPHTCVPVLNDQGEVEQWVQRTGRNNEQRYPPDQITNILLNKSSGRDKVGVSEVLRNKEEIEVYRRNEQAVDKAIEVTGIPHLHWQIGREDGPPVSDEHLRRYRSLFSDMDGDTQIYTGTDVNIDQIDGPSQFDPNSMTERHMKKLSAAIGVPIELANFGSDGLGSGMPAEFRKDMLALENDIRRRMFSNQFVEYILKPIVREYTEFDHRQDIRLEIQPFLDDRGDTVDLINAVGDYMSTQEVRDRLGLSPLEDEDLRDSYVSPAERERQESEDLEENTGGGLEEIFNADHDLQDVDDIDTSPPEYMVEAAEAAADAGEDGVIPSDCGTGVGDDRRTAIINDSVGPETWGEIASYLTSHEEDVTAEGHPRDWTEDEWGDCGNAQFAKWGGTGDGRAKEYAQRKANEVARALDEEEPYELADADAQLSAEDFDSVMLDLYDNLMQSDNHDRALLTFSESQTPEFVKERIRDSLLEGGLFTEFEEFPSEKVMALRMELLETLQSDGWTIADLADTVSTIAPDSNAEVLARTETAAVLNRARERGYEELGRENERFRWANPMDHRTTEACEWLVRQTDPEHGGTPVSMDELKELIAEAPEHDEDMDDNLARPDDFVVHPQERSRFIRVPDA